MTIDGSLKRSDTACRTVNKVTYTCTSNNVSILTLYLHFFVSVHSQLDELWQSIDARPKTYAFVAADAI